MLTNTAYGFNVLRVYWWIYMYIVDYTQSSTGGHQQRMIIEEQRMQQQQQMYQQQNSAGGMLPSHTGTLQSHTGTLQTHNTLPSQTSTINQWVVFRKFEPISLHLVLFPDRLWASTSTESGHQTGTSLTAGTWDQWAITIISLMPRPWFWLHWYPLTISKYPNPSACYIEFDMRDFNTSLLDFFLKGQHSSCSLERLLKANTTQLFPIGQAIFNIAQSRHTLTVNAIVQIYQLPQKIISIFGEMFQFLVPLHNISTDYYADRWIKFLFENACFIACSVWGM